ncbi:hypothetical protein AQUSIP_04020 [Aquicella siphonis]|uniref:Uncharacterized protein n=1 Tax=Aquicella siphonis TaxID=254247 RepID=A0A5E4PFM1_9COXI|nr:hypothetical protein [Aquicella siphonis]VVC75126.1 hypothetical protein AQUSIP_04020 [Aquicella siphonis]
MMTSSNLIVRVIEESLSKKDLSLSQLSDFIADQQNISEIFAHFERQNGISILHRILERSDDLPDAQNHILAFMSRFAAHINLNAKNARGDTILHVIARKNFHLAAQAVCDARNQFAALPDLYALDARGKTPAELASDETRVILDAALSYDFSRRVVLVHPLQSNSILNCLFDTGKEYLAVYDESRQNYNEALSAVNAVVHDDTMLTDDAVIGAHLAFEQNQYTDSFVDRPHIHWWWNGLFQANSGGDWENSLIAYLEPLSQFNHVLGCAYYDTMTVGPHRLSDESCIIVPNDSVGALRARLGSYGGKIIGFDPETTSLRAAINQVIREHFPDSLCLMNQSEEDINEHAMSNGEREFNDRLCRERDYDRHAGYFNRVFVKTPQGNTAALMSGSSHIEYRAYELFARGKFVGLHSHSPTDHERDWRMKLLMKVSRSPALIGNEANMTHFIGRSGRRQPDQLCIVKAYAVYARLLELHPKTGAHAYANYLMKKALIADFRSIHHETGGRPLDKEQLRQMIDHHFDYLLKQLSVMCASGSESDIQKYRAAMQGVYNLVMVLPLENEIESARQGGSDSADRSPVASQSMPRASESSHGFWNRHKNTIIAVGLGMAVVGGLVAGTAYCKSKSHI